MQKKNELSHVKIETAISSPDMSNTTSEIAEFVDCSLAVIKMQHDGKWVVLRVIDKKGDLLVATLHLVKLTYKNLLVKETRVLSQVRPQWQFIKHCNVSGFQADK